MYQAILFVLCAFPPEISGGNAKINSNVLGNDSHRQNVTSLKTDKVVGITQLSVISLVNKTVETDRLENASNFVTVNKTTQAIKLSTNETFPYDHTATINEKERTHILLKIHATITRSKDAVWATIVLTFMCVLLVLAVAQSRMWKDYKGSDSQGVPLPNFNERVLFRDVMERRMKSLKEFFKKKEKKSVTELESLLTSSDELD